MHIQGTITQVLPLKEGLSQQGTLWKKQTYVVMEDDAEKAFPNEMVVDLFNDKIPVTQLTVGQRVDVHFCIRTREYNGRVYNDVNVVKLKIEN